MATTLGRMVTYHEVLWLIKPHDPFITWPCEVTWQTKAITCPITQCLLIPNLEGGLTYCERLPSLKPHDPLLMWPMWCNMAFLKICILTFTTLMPTKLGRVLNSGRSFSMQTLKCSRFLVQSVIIHSQYPCFLFPEISRMNFFLSLTRPNSQMCIRIYICISFFK